MSVDIPAVRDPNDDDLPERIIDPEDHAEFTDADPVGSLPDQSLGTRSRFVAECLEGTTDPLDVLRWELLEVALRGGGQDDLVHPYPPKS